MESDADRLVRYRNYAEELRIIAGDRLDPQDYEVMMRVAADYDRLARSLEGVIRSRECISRER